MDGKDLASLFVQILSLDTCPLQALGIGVKMDPGSVGWSALSVRPEKPLASMRLLSPGGPPSHLGQAPPRQFKVQPVLDFCLGLPSIQQGPVDTLRYLSGWTLFSLRFAMWAQDCAQTQSTARWAPR